MLIKNQFFNIKNIDVHCKLYLPDKLSENQPWVILLHQGLGSISQWKSFPNKLFNAINLPIFLYERIGYAETGTILNPLPENFLQIEAYEILPELIEKAHIKKHYLVGHSDGATISLLYASKRPQQLIGITAMTPHVFVEEITKQGIQKLINDYNRGILSFFLQKYHHEKTDTLFRRWTQFWLNEPLVSWNMFYELKNIDVPLLLIQGDNDEFGSLKQLEYIEQYSLSKIEKLIINDCRHNPHLEHASIVVEAIKKAIYSTIDSH
ncbi:MAG: alpha/beta hydrolase [Bacteroidales bacterium]|nr:alpha/beta hydrolase [Bacteroidales bacterium]